MDWSPNCRLGPARGGRIKNSALCETVSFAAMRCLIVAFLLLVACASATPRCALQCYRGTVTWADATTLDYAFSVVPCAPVLVASATLDDGGDTLVAPTFGCVASGGVVAITLDHAGGAHLEWRYETPDTCDTVLASLATIPGIFVGTAHRASPTAAAITDGASLESAQIVCAATTCTPLCFDSGVLPLAGVAGDKSPCGASGADACPMRVQYTLSLCDEPPRVVALDVLVGGDGVRLSNYQPGALVGAQFSCDDAAIHLDAAGVALEWALPVDNRADCASLLLRPDVLATGNLRAAMVQLSAGEMWTASSLRLSQPIIASGALCNNMPTQMPGATDASDETPSPSVAPEVPVAPSNDATAETHPTLDRAIVPSVYCSSRVDAQCCTVFGYTNPNPSLVVLPVGRPQNFLVPKGGSGAPPTHFSHNSTVAAAFSVLWECKEYEQHTMRWVVQTGAPHGLWRRAADGVRTRDDCLPADYNTWCT